MRKTAFDFLPIPSWPRSCKIHGEQIEIIGRWHFLVKSKSQSGWHCVDLEYVDGAPGGCTCTGFRVRGECRHFQAVVELILELAETS